MRFRRAFTLVELLAVVAIIAVLLALLLPSLNKAREYAKAAQCQSNQHQCSLAFLTYASDYQGLIAVGGTIPQSMGNAYVGIPWMDYLAGKRFGNTKYLDSQTHAQHCPKNSNKAWYGPKSGGGAYAFIQPTSYLFVDPARVGAVWDKTLGSTWQAQGRFVAIRINAVPTPSDYIFLTDSAVRDGFWGLLNRRSPEGVYSLNTWLPQSPTGGGQVAAVWLTHPGDRTNALFADGSVAACEGDHLLGVSNVNPDGSWSYNHRGISQWWAGDGTPRHY